jgi:hypothetical protein
MADDRYPKASAIALAIDPVALYIGPGDPSRGMILDLTRGDSSRDRAIDAREAAREG